MRKSQAKNLDVTMITSLSTNKDKFPLEEKKDSKWNFKGLEQWIKW